MVLIEYPKADGEKKTFYLSGYMQKNLDNYVKGVINKNTSAVFIFDGRSGLGKTTLSFQTACYINLEVRKMLKKKGETDLPDFKLEDNIYWTPKEFIERLKRAKKGEVIILDESMILSNKSSMSEMNKAVVVMMSMIRSKQIFVIFNANSIFDIDKNLPLHRADMLVHLYAIDDKFASRGRYFVVPSAKGRLKYLYISGKKFYDYSKAWPAFRDRFSGWFPFDQDKYEKRKQDAINSYFNEEKVRPQDNSVMVTRAALCYFLNRTGVKWKEIGDIANASGSALSATLAGRDHKYIDDLIKVHGWKFTKNPPETPKKP